MVLEIWPAFEVAPEVSNDNFEQEKLSNNWSFIRIPPLDFYSLNTKKGFLSLKLLNANLSQVSAPAFSGQRLKYRSGEIVTKMTFEPKSTNEQAGLALYKSENAHLTFTVS